MAFRRLARSFRRPRLVGRYVLGIAGQTADYSLTLSSLSGGLASTPANGDFIIVGTIFPGSDAAINIRDAGGTAYPYTVADLFSSDSASANLHVAAKFAGATPDTTVTIPGSGSTSAGQAFGVEVWRGVNIASPFDVTTTTATGANTGRPNPPAITPNTKYAEIVVFGGGTAFFASGADFTSSAFDNFASATGSDTGSGTIGIGEFAWTTGAFDAAAFGGGDAGTGSAWAAAAMALRPG